MTRKTLASTSLPDGGDLADRLRRLDEAKENFYAVRLEGARNQRLISQPWPFAVVWQPLALVTEDEAATLYCLGEADLVLLCDNVPVDRVDDAVGRVQRLLQSASAAGRGAPPAVKVSWFDLLRRDDFEGLLSIAERGRRRPANDALRSIEIADLPSILVRMEQIPIARMIRRQNVLHIPSSGKLSPLFQQLYVSIGEFQRAFAPGIDTTAHPDLYRHLSWAFDRKLLSYLLQKDSADLTRGPFCINVDVSTAALPQFSRFEGMFAKRDNIMLEIPFENILEDFASYQHLRQRTRDARMGLVLGGLTLASCLTLDLSNLDVEAIKVPCPGTQASEAAVSPGDALERCLPRIGRDRVILTGVESEERMRWALGIGISRFQGHYIEKLIAALTLKGKTASGVPA